VRRLAAALSDLRAAIIHEADRSPSQIRAYGRPHEYGRSRNVPQFSRNGVPTGRSTHIGADCPKPFHGRCECPPDGSWRPSPGAIRADAIAHHALFEPADGSKHSDEDHKAGIGCTYEGAWGDDMYELDRDRALWYCTRPHARALERLKGENMRSFLVLDRLLEGLTLYAAWKDLGRPVDPVHDALGIIATVNTFAAQEAATEYERRPRRWRQRVMWLEKSEAQQAAEVSA
jgi:hypothetical protein